MHGQKVLKLSEIFEHFLKKIRFQTPALDSHFMEENSAYTLPLIIWIIVVENSNAAFQGFKIISIVGLICFQFKSVFHISIFRPIWFGNSIVKFILIETSVCLIAIYMGYIIESL